jgi:hypothetical protein
MEKETFYKELTPNVCVFAVTKLRGSRHILSRWGKNVSWTSRKATRGSVLWTPRRSGEPKGETRVAARAVRRGLEPRISLTLNRTSDRVFPRPFIAARGLRSRQRCGRWRDPAWSLYQIRTMCDIRAHGPTLCTMLPAFGALSFFHRARRYLSFGKTKER